MNFVLHVMRVRVYSNYALLLRITTPLSRLFHGNYNFHVDALARQASGTLTFSIVDFLLKKISEFSELFNATSTPALTSRSIDDCGTL